MRGVLPGHRRLRARGLGFCLLLGGLGLRIGLRLGNRLFALLGLGLGVGLGVGLGLAVRSVNRIRAIATEAAAAGGPPTAAQAAEMQRLQARAGTAMRVTSLLLLAAAAVMGTARYW